jgi:hypothetical protein
MPAATKKPATMIAHHAWLKITSAHIKRVSKIAATISNARKGPVMSVGALGVMRLVIHPHAASTSPIVRGVIGTLCAGTLSRKADWERGTSGGETSS